MAKEKKSESTLQGTKIHTVRKQHFEDLWEQSQSISPLFDQWIDHVEAVLWDKLLKALHLECIDHKPGHILGISGVISDDEDDSNAKIIRSLYDPSAPYSLMIEEIYFACRPNQELWTTWIVSRIGKMLYFVFACGMWELHKLERI